MPGYENIEDQFLPAGEAKIYPSVDEPLEPGTVYQFVKYGFKPTILGVIRYDQGARASVTGKDVGFILSVGSRRYQFTGNDQLEILLVSRSANNVPLRRIVASWTARDAQ
ncbi:MAG: hypothetical protein UY21_C0009G0101 [Microgenomates group bacterium GW2011_GWA1_48_10]|nr:MAG: hypothetical protein UY21_C0009G0101 [Microgenomates group bacterium GW2011_GWA1_48_10]